MRLRFWRLVRDLGEAVMDAGYAVHWFARGRITAAHMARMKKET